jgi:hypothetical protein
MADLITLDDYKSSKGITSTTRDGKLQNLITQITQLIEHYCNRKFTQFATSGNGKVEWHDGKTNKVFLDAFPVISVVSVKTSADGGVTQITLTEGASDNTGYFVDLEEGSVFLQVSVGKFITSYNLPYRSLEIDYLAGYTADNIPADLKLCTIDLVHYYENNEQVNTKSLLGGTLDNPLPYLANSFPPHIRRILDLYRFSP